MLTYIVGAGAMGCRFGYQMAEAGQNLMAGKTTFKQSKKKD